MSFLPEIPGFAYLFIILVVFQGSLFFVLLFIFIERFISSKPRKRQDELIKEEAYNEAIKTLEKARQESLQILNSAREKSESDATAVKFSTDHLKGELDKKINDLVAELSEELQRAVRELIMTADEKLSNEAVSTIASYKESTQQLSKLVEAEIKNYAIGIKQSLQDFKESSSKNMSEAMRESIGSIKQFEDTQKKTLDDKVYKIATMAAKDLIGRSMTVNDNEDFILKILSEAEVKALF